MPPAVKFLLVVMDSSPIIVILSIPTGDIEPNEKPNCSISVFEATLSSLAFKVCLSFISFTVKSPRMQTIIN